MVSGLTPPSKRDLDEKRDENIESLRDSVRFTAPTTNILNTMGSKVGGGGSQIVPAVQGLFATSPSERPEAIEITYTEATTITNPLKTGDEITTGANGWTGKLIQITNTNVSNDVNRKEALFSNTSTVEFSNTGQTFSKTGWSATYVTNTQTPNALVLGSSAPIVSCTLTRGTPSTTGNPIIKQIYGTSNNGQILFMKPKDTKTLTLTTGGNIDISADVTVSDSEFVILQYFEDVNAGAGKYLLLSGGGGTSTWVGTATSSLNMSTFDINTLDRLLFSTSGTDNLSSTDYGIATDSTDSNNLHYNVPSGKHHDFDVAGSNMININPVSGTTIQTGLYVNGTLTSTGNTSFNGNVDIGNSTADSLTITSTLDAQLRMGNNKITGLATPTVNTDAATKAYVDASGGGWVGTATSQLNMGAYSIVGAWGGTASTLGIQSDLDMNTYDILDVCRVELNTTGSNVLAAGTTGINGTADEMHFNVPTGDDFRFTIQGTEEFVFKGNELDVKDNDICNVGTIFTDYISMSSGNANIRVWGHLDPVSDGDYDLGSTSLYWRTLRIDGQLYTRGSIYLLGTAKFIDMNTNNLVFSSGGRVDFANDTGTPSGAGGYVRVKIGGADKFIPYYT